MKISIHHPESQSLEHVVNVIADKQPIRRSPHIGNVAGDELQLVLGLAEMGANLSLEMVDTIHGGDKYSNPRYLLTGRLTLVLASRKHAEGRVVTKCFVSREGAKEAMAHNLGFDIKEGDSLAAFHNASLKEVLPATVHTELSSDFFRSIGNDVLTLALQASAATINRPLRTVLENGKIVHINLVKGAAFDDGSNQIDKNLLLPVEAMMALEVIHAALNQNGKDGQITHIAGLDMSSYTKSEETMRSMKTIASKVASELGLSSCVRVDYFLPSRPAILSEPHFPKVIPDGIESQYDLLLNDTRIAVNA